MVEGRVILSSSLFRPGSLVRGNDDSGLMYGSLCIDDESEYVLTMMMSIDASTVGVVVAVRERHCLVVSAVGVFWTVRGGGRWDVVEGLGT